MSWVIAGLLWALVVAKAVTSRRRGSRVMLWCALVFAISFSTDIDTLFQPLDRALGGWNITNIVGHLLFSTGVYLLSLSVMRAALPDRVKKYDPWGRTLLVIVLIIQTLTFAAVRTTGSAPGFSTAYGTQDAALWYALVEILYTILVLGGTALMALVHLGKFHAGRYRIGMLLTAVGCIFAIATEVTGIEYVIRIHDRTLAGLSVFARWHDVLFALAGLLLVTGFAFASVAGWVQRWIRRREAGRRLAALQPVWEEATVGRPTIPLGDSAHPVQRLHRMTVEIQDASRVDAEVNVRLHRRFGDEAEQIISDSERFLAGQRV